MPVGLDILLYLLMAAVGASALGIFEVSDEDDDDTQSDPSGSGEMTNGTSGSDMLEEDDDTTEPDGDDDPVSL